MRKHILWALVVMLCVGGAAPLWAQTAASQAQVATNSPVVPIMRHDDLSSQVVKTVYFAHLSHPTEIQDVQNALRTILEFTRISPIQSGTPAMVIRGSADQVSRAEKLIAELDRATPPPVPAPQAAPAPVPAANPSYRLDFTLTEFEDGKKVNTRTYSMILQRGTKSNVDAVVGQFRVGSRVPVATGSFQPGIGGVGTNPIVNTQFQYLDVGVNIDCQLWGADDDLTFYSNIEVSGMSTPRDIGGLSQPVIRQTKSRVTGAITAGKPTMIAALDAVDSPRRMEISVTATKLK